MDDLIKDIKKSPVTAGLIAINILIFLIVDLTGAGSENTGHMLDCGAAFAPYIIEKKEYYRLFSCMFLHFGITHLLNNMLVLFVLGERLEPIVGKVKMILIYILGGLTGNLLSLYFEMKTNFFAVSAGASGAVFALMGSMIYVIARHKGRLADLTVRRMVLMAIVSVYLGFMKSGVDNAAHIGGLCGGLLITVLLYHPKKRF
ncbi:MAG: rhomboid family intramembrane serine protease [Eubacteriales bacterium]|nr:rhomboid family intramembrane serine protease [Eubacteriales bacterium]